MTPARTTPRTKQRRGHSATSSDVAVVRRAGQIAAVQASVALAAVLLVVGAVVLFVDVRVQNQQITRQLVSVAATADDVNDPPPGMTLALRDLSGNVSVGAHATVTLGLLAGPPGLSDVDVDHRHYRALVADNTHGRVVALIDLEPFETGRNRLLLSLGVAELAGIAASVGVVILLTRRSIRPLTQALDLQRRFVADASHELRAPLTVLHTRAQLLDRRLDRLPPEEIKKQLGGLVEDTRALGDVVEDLLASASLTTGSAPKDEVDLAAVADRVRDSMSVHAKSLGVTLDFERSPSDAVTEAFTVLGSETALRRAVTSLVDNALTHQRSGGTVLVRVRRDADRVVVDVRDTGAGLDPSITGTLFSRFSHGENQPGSGRRYGIGLALVREIAHAHGGEITAAANPDQGATFTLTIPAAPTDH